MKKRPSIGAGLIVKNESENLRRVVESLKNCVDEVYITDTGSSDDTVEIAKGLGCKVSYFEWVDDFSAARNFNDTQIKTDFSLFIDADDVLDNPKEFINFRDHVMNTGDFFITNYQYASYPDGSPACQFIRERVFRMDKKIPWSYPVHEGKIPSAKYGPVRVQYIPTWQVKHLRSANDLKADKSRNLKILEKQDFKKLDARMIYYFGKELFENQKQFDSIRMFELALNDPKLEIHDRILAVQYYCYALMHCNQFEKAMEVALTGIKLAGSRAEFFNLVADSLVKMGKILEAKPFFSAARNCVQNLGPSPIFSSREAYDIYPGNQLARIEFQTGNIKKCINLLKELNESTQNNETTLLLKEAERVEKITTNFRSATPKNEIVFTCPEQGCRDLFDEDVLNSGFSGGSETALVEMARSFGKKGFKVKVFNRRDSIKEFGNVTYIPANQMQDYLGHTKPSVHIAWRHNMKLTDAPTFVWSHDLVTPGVETKFYEKILCLTPFHKQYFHTMTGVPLDWIALTRNGLNINRYQNSKTVPKNELKFVFTSSPDRGLDRAIKVMDHLREWTGKELELHVFYGLEKLHPEFHKELKFQLEKMIAERPWIKYHGGVSESVLIEHLREAVMLPAPSDWIETSKITALQMLALGVFPVERKIGGVVDTLGPYAEKNMAAFFDGECVSSEEILRFAQLCFEHYSARSWENIKDFDLGRHSWDVICQEWIDLFKKSGIELKN